MKMIILLVLMVLVTPEMATAINIKRKMVMMAEGTTKTSAAVTTEVQINKEEKEKRPVVDSREQAQINNHHSIPRQAWDANNQDENNGPATDLQNKDATLPAGNHG
ncbi:hypothetical protein LguiB_035108 [Lonicera macranthoides]